MNKEQAESLLSTLVEQLDYDLYKEMFLYNQDPNAHDNLIRFIRVEVWESISDHIRSQSEVLLQMLEHATKEQWHSDHVCAIMALLDINRKLMSDSLLGENDDSI